MKVCKILQTLLWLASRLIWVRSMVVVAGLLATLFLSAAEPLRFHVWDELVGSGKHPLKSPEVFGIVDLEGGGQRLFATNAFGNSVLVIDVDVDGSMKLCDQQLTGNSGGDLGSLLRGIYHRALSDGSWQLVVRGYSEGVIAVVVVAANGTISWVDEIRDSESTPMKYARTANVRPLPNGTLRIMFACELVPTIAVVDMAENGTVSWVGQLGKHQAPLEDPLISEVYQLADGEFRLFVSDDGSKNIVVADVALNGNVSLKGVMPSTDERPLRSPSLWGVRPLPDGGQRVLVADYHYHSLGVLDVAANGTAKWCDYVRSTPDRPLKKPASAGAVMLANGDWRVVVGCTGSRNIAVFDVATNGSLSWKSQLTANGAASLKFPEVKSIRNLDEGGHRLLISSWYAVLVVDLSTNGTASLRSLVTDCLAIPLSGLNIGGVQELGDGALRVFASSWTKNNVMVIDVDRNGTAMCRGSSGHLKHGPFVKELIAGFRDVQCNRTRLFVYGGGASNNLAVVDFEEARNSSTPLPFGCLPFPEEERVSPPTTFVEPVTTSVATQMPLSTSAAQISRYFLRPSSSVQLNWTEGIEPPVYSRTVTAAILWVGVATAAVATGLSSFLLVRCLCRLIPTEKSGILEMETFGE